MLHQAPSVLNVPKFIELDEEASPADFQLLEAELLIESYQKIFWMENNKLAKE